MEPILKDSGKVKGLEILFFEDVEIEKIKGNCTSFASMGTLSVLYFKDYNRFMLQLNDWRYPLLRRLPIISSSKTETSFRTYILPGANGFSFQLRLHNIPNLQSLSNLETIFNSSSSFSFKGEEINPLRKIENSPDDKLVRHLLKETGPKEVMTEMLKTATEKIKVTAETLKMHTKNIKSTKKRMNLKDIKNRNFKKMAHSKLKGDFFKTGEKLTEEFLMKRRTNLLLTQVRDFEMMRKMTEKDVPIFYEWKEEIEESILRNKDIAIRGNFNLNVMPEKKGFMESLKAGINEIKETFSGMLGGPSSVQTSQVGQGPMEAHSKEMFKPTETKMTETYIPSTESRRGQENLPPEDRSRDINKDRPMNPNVQGQSTQSKIPGFEGMTHYQG